MDDVTKLMVVIIVFIVIGLPVILGIGGDVLKRLIAHREKRMEIEANMTAERAAQYAAHTERLEQRVRVLERIVTDKGTVVAGQIEELRENPLN
jgi:hypothetical protein